MLGRALSAIEIRNLQKCSCKCNHDCFNKLSFSKIRELRKNFWTQSKSVRKLLLKQYILNSVTEGRFKMFSVCSNTKLCSKAFLAVLRINKNTLTVVTKSLEYGHHAPQLTKSRCQGTLQLISWLEEFSSYNTDRMPDSLECFLPYGTKKMDVFNQFIFETNASIGKSTFFSVWGEYFPHLKIKQESTYTFKVQSLL